MPPCSTPAITHQDSLCSIESNNSNSSGVSLTIVVQDDERRALVSPVPPPEEDPKSFSTTFWNKLFQVDSTQCIQMIKYAYSFGLLAFCLQLILAGIWANDTPVAEASCPVVATVMMVLLILWLGVLEGGQGCLVGLQPIDKTLYADSHPIAWKCTVLAHEGDNLNRFIVGRQFLVVLVVFCLNLCCTIVEDAVVPGMPDAAVELLLASGLAVMIITVILGQLSAEVNATDCMLDFINSPLVYVTTWICLTVESSGLLHAVYLVQYLFQRDTQNKESVFFYARMAFSCLLLGAAMVVTLWALVHDQTTLCQGLPDVASLSIFWFLVCFLGMLEAMQIAFFAVVNLPEEELKGNKRAVANCKLAFSGNNFQAFLIGRQICVTLSMFLLARITTTDVDPQEQATVLGMSAAWQDFFNTGLPGALITTIVASLAWRIMASSFPVAFMANPLTNFIIRLCLLLEASGIFSTAWMLAGVLKRIVGFRNDEVYIGVQGQRDTEEKDTVDDGETGSVSTTSTSTGTYGSIEV